ncbi:MAG TPA: hypothetical protein VHG28_21465 [Longimicrobiaceae bacterium]|nr:hypothetical protein [Longimicrobiaceae bacterium]
MVALNILALIFIVAVVLILLRFFVKNFVPLAMIGLAVAGYSLFYHPVASLIGHEIVNTIGFFGFLAIVSLLRSLFTSNDVGPSSSDGIGLGIKDSLRKMTEESRAAAEAARSREQDAVLGAMAEAEAKRREQLWESGRGL